MTRDQALTRLREILRGIDQDDCESNDGWWETGTGVEFGKERLRLLEALVTDLTI